MFLWLIVSVSLYKINTIIISKDLTDNDTNQ